MGKKMINNSKKNDAHANKLSLDGVLTKALEGLIEHDDIILSDQDKKKTNQEQDELKEQIRISLIRDAIKITAAAIKDNYGNTKEEIITKISDKFLEQKRGEENLKTPEGRVAQAIREKANSSSLFFSVSDDLIKNGGPFTDGLKQKIGKILTENEDEIKTALAVEGTGKNLTKDGVTTPPQSFGGKLSDAVERGLETPTKIFTAPQPRANGVVHSRP